MRRLTLDYMAKLVKAMPKLALDRRPALMPGKKWPTRVAWYIQLANRKPITNSSGEVVKFQIENVRHLSYIGKPSQYRALEARKFLEQTQSSASHIVEMWQAEFDKAGLVAYRLWKGKNLTGVSGAFWAYHPHSPQVDIVEAFSRPLHIKYIGGMRLYSQKKRLSQEAVDAYYEWYHQQFKRRLRRPKATASAVIGGEVVELTETQANSAPTENS